MQGEFRSVCLAALKLGAQIAGHGVYAAVPGWAEPENVTGSSEEVPAPQES